MSRNMALTPHQVKRARLLKEFIVEGLGPAAGAMIGGASITFNQNDYRNLVMLEGDTITVALKEYILRTKRDAKGGDEDASVSSV